jgi:hypothetical protein
VQGMHNCRLEGTNHPSAVTTVQRCVASEVLPCPYLLLCWLPLQVIIVDEIATKEVGGSYKLGLQSCTRIITCMTICSCRNSHLVSACIWHYQRPSFLSAMNPRPLHRYITALHRSHPPLLVHLQEAAACRTIAARGVLLVSTAHGSSLGDLLRNPDLQGLVGGVKAVTLGDKLANTDNRGQKVCKLCMLGWGVGDTGSLLRLGLFGFQKRKHKHKPVAQSRRCVGRLPSRLAVSQPSLTCWIQQEGMPWC